MAWSAVEAQMLDAVSQTLAAVAALQPGERPLAPRFELIRYDFQLDRAGTPWLLEVNSNPNMNPSSAGHAALLQRLAGFAVSKLGAIVNGAPAEGKLVPAPLRGRGLGPRSAPWPRGSRRRRPCADARGLAQGAPQPTDPAVPDAAAAKPTRTAAVPSLAVYATLPAGTAAGTAAVAAAAVAAPAATCRWTTARAARPSSGTSGTWRLSASRRTRSATRATSPSTRRARRSCGSWRAARAPPPS